MLVKFGQNTHFVFDFNDLYKKKKKKCMHSFSGWILYLLYLITANTRYVSI
jgi:hypothetical protein